MTVERMLVGICIQSEALAAGVKSRGEHLSVRSAPGLPNAKSVIVIPSPARLADKAHHALCTVRKMGLEPFDKNGLNLVRETQEYVVCLFRPGVRGRLQYRLYLVVVDRRDNRGNQNADRNAAVVDFSDSTQP